MTLAIKLGEEELDTVWFGEISKDLRARAKSYYDWYNKKKTAHWLQTLYYKSNTVGVIATANLLPKIDGALTEMSVEDEVLSWVHLGID
jgi:hypothetical protein